MENSKYLPIGLKLGGHYEIVNVLGEDDFEILYAVKDLHRLNTPYVIKELFLNSYSLRDERHQLYTPAKSKYVFEETKKEVIEEIQLLLKESVQPSHIIGYFEENNTIYTIMEFIDNHNLNIYLNDFKKSSKKSLESISTPEKKVENLPSIKVLEEKVDRRNKSKSSFFQKLLMGTLLLFSLLGLYAYYMITSQGHKIEEEQNNNVKVVVKNHPTAVHYPPLVDRNKEQIEVNSSQTEQTQNATRAQDNQTTTLKGDSFGEFNNTIDELVYMDSETEEIDEEKIVKKEPSKEPIDTPFNRRSVKIFLDKFITASINGSLNEILSYYDNRVERYFSLKNVNKKIIYNDKRKYHYKWANREFTIIDFDIVRVYKRDGADYCDIRTKTQWRVSSSDFSKTASGISKGVMSIKEIDNLFKVTSIYTTKK